MLTAARLLRFRITPDLAQFALNTPGVGIQSRESYDNKNQQIKCLVALSGFFEFLMRNALGVSCHVSFTCDLPDNLVVGPIPDAVGPWTLPLFFNRKKMIAFKVLSPIRKT